MMRWLVYLVLSGSLASSPGHTIKYKTPNGDYVEEEVSSSTYDVIPDDFDETTHFSNPWDMNTSTSWSEWPTTPVKPELRINSYEVEKDSSSSDEHDVLLAGSKIKCILSIKAFVASVSTALLFGTLYWRDLLCKDVREIGLLSVWITMMVLALAEEFLSVIDFSLSISRYFNIGGVSVILLRIMGFFTMLLPLIKFIGLAWVHGDEGGTVRSLCNTTLVSPFVQWRWLGLEMVPAVLLFLTTLLMIKANSMVMDENTGSIVIYDRIP